MNVEIKSITDFFKEKTSDTIFLLGTGSSINEIKRWDEIFKHDTLCINDWYNHPSIVPKWCHIEIIGNKNFLIAKNKLEKCWERGWKNVGFIVQEEALDILLLAIDHLDLKNTKIFKYKVKNRGKRKEIKNISSNADFDPNNGNIYKSYCFSITNIIHLLYLMGYKKIICWGVDMINSKYFWTDMAPEVRGEVDLLYENIAPSYPHRSILIASYIIDFNKRHMIPQNKEILIGNKTTALYPSLKLWDGKTYE